MSFPHFSLYYLLLLFFKSVTDLDTFILIWWTYMGLRDFKTIPGRSHPPFFCIFPFWFFFYYFLSYMLSNKINKSCRLGEFQKSPIIWVQLHDWWPILHWTSAETIDLTIHLPSFNKYVGSFHHEMLYVIKGGYHFDQWTKLICWTTYDVPTRHHPFSFHW